MISLKKFLDRSSHPREDPELNRAALQMARLLMDAMLHHTVPGREADFQAFARTLDQLLRRMDNALAPIDLLGVSSDAVGALEEYSLRTIEYLREQSQQLQSMLAMLTSTVADISGQSADAARRLQTIEKQIEQASDAEDMRALKSRLAGCLDGLREAAAQQRKNSALTIQRLENQITTAQGRATTEAALRPTEIAEPDPPDEAGGAPEVATTAYVAAFRIRRILRITERFGDSTRHKLLSMVGAGLKNALGPRDRLLRWKAASFVMFINAAGGLASVRARISGEVAALGAQYLDVRNGQAFLSVNLDWIVFPQKQCPSLDAVFAEVDAFLSRNSAVSSSGN